MEMFEDLAALKGSGTPYDGLKPITEAERDIVALAPFSAPADYLAFLSEIGWGALGDYNFMLYSGLIDAEDIYGERPDLPENWKSFGDDFSGYNVGFYSGRSEVFEITPGSMTVDLKADSFSDFIRSKIKTILSWREPPAGE